MRAGQTASAATLLILLLACRDTEFVCNMPGVIAGEGRSARDGRDGGCYFGTAVGLAWSLDRRRSAYMLLVVHALTSVAFGPQR